MNKIKRVIRSKLKFSIIFFNIFNWGLQKFRNPVVRFLLLLNICFTLLSVQYGFSLYSDNYNYVREPASSWDEAIVNYLFSETFNNFAGRACFLIAILGLISGIYLLIGALLNDID